ncbi:MAG: hypothetical protein RIR26_1378, partial [Pseudomonadota bacterium]
GAVYEVYRKLPNTGDEYPDDPINTIMSASVAIDDVVEDKFPRCYRIRVRHPLFFNVDSNAKEVCLSEEDFNRQKMMTSDLEPPVFAGIKAISAVKVDTLLSAVTTTLGLSAGVNVVLSWDSAKDKLTRDSRLYYKVFRAQSSFGFDLSQPIATTKPGQLSYTDTTISKGAIYYYLVRAYDEQGNSDLNLTQKILPLDLVPPVFSGLRSGVTKRSATAVKVQLAWDPASDDQTPSQGMVYEIFRSQTLGSFPSVPIGKTNGIVQYEDTSAERNLVYYYRVNAIDAEGNRESNSKVLTVNTGETPPVFMGLKTATLMRSKGELRWEPAEDDETPTSSIVYRVYRRDEAGSFNFRSPLFQLSGGLLSYTDVSVNTNYAYYYVVRAVDEQGFEDTNTNEVLLPANAPPLVTVAPTVQWDKTQNCMRVSWLAATDDSTPASQMSYRIFRSGNASVSSFNFSRALDETTSGVRTFLDCDASGTNGYSYIVRAIDSDLAEGPNSPVVSISANQPPSPGTISQISIVDGKSVEIRWNVATDDRSLPSEISYKVYRFPKWTGPWPPKRSDTDYNSNNVVGNIDPSVAPRFLDQSGVNSQAEYSWLIRPVDKFGIEALNTEDEVSLSENMPPSFNGVSTISISGIKGANITWTLATDDRTPQNQITYKIYHMEVPSSTPSGADPNFPIPTQLSSQLFQANSGTELNLKQSITGSVSTLTLQMPDSNKSYLFGIRACDGQNRCDTNLRTLATPANTPPVFNGIDTLSEGSNGITLTWLAATDDRDGSSDIIYSVYRLVSDQANVTAAEITSVGKAYRTTLSGVSSFIDDALVPSAYNHYVVRAVDKSLAEDTNAIVKSVAPDRIPPVFFGIKTATMTGAKITLTWDAALDNRTVTSRMRYRIYESLSSNYSDIVSTVPIMEITNGAQSFIRTPPTGAKYFYVVKSVDEATNTDGNETIRNTEDVIPPSFSGLITGYAVTSSGAQLFWSDTPNDDIAQFKIYKTDDLANAIASVSARDSTGLWTNSYLVTDLTAATSYSFIVRASDAFGNEETNTASVNLITLAGVSPLFAGLTKAETMDGVAGLSGVDLSWSEAANATHYRIFRVPGTSARGEEFNFDYDSCRASWSSANVPGCTEIDSTVGTTYSVSGLQKNTTYSFIVRALAKLEGRVVGEEMNRVIRTVTTNDEKAPTFAGAKSVSPAGGVAGVDTMELKWDLPSRDGVYDGYTILYKNLGSGNTFQIPTTLSPSDGITAQDVIDPASTSAYVSGLTYNVRYCFTVRTRYSPKSDVRSIPAASGFVCGIPIPQAPNFAGVKGKVTLGTGALGFSQMTVEWDQAQGSFSNYEVSWSIINDYYSDAVTGSFFQDSNKAVISTQSTTSYTLTNLQPNTSYYVRVRAKFSMPNLNLLLFSGGDVIAQAVTTPLAPAGDGILSAKQIGDDQIEVRWDAPNNAGLFDRYFIFRASGATADSQVLQGLNPDANKSCPESPPYLNNPVSVGQGGGAAFTGRVFNDSTDIAPNTRYCYVVRAGFCGAQGFVASLNTKKLCVDVQIKPPEFAGITNVKTPVNVGGFTSLTAQWKAATGNFTSYQYAIGTTPDDFGPWTDVDGGIDTAQVTIDQLMPYTEYFIKVRATYKHLSSGQIFASGENMMKTGVTTPKAPEHGGLEPVVFLDNPGEVRISWTKPDANPEVGGLYDRFLVWRYEGASPSDVLAEVDNLMADGVISAGETVASNTHVREVLNTITQVTYQGATKLTENIQTCFLVRAAFRGGPTSAPYFVMSSNQMVRCVTPTASAPQFSGLATLQNIPTNVNGFSQLMATWVPAGGIFTRYELAASMTSGISSWSTLAFMSSNKTLSQTIFSNTDIVAQGISTKLKAFKRYYARVRAIYVGADGTVYASGDSTELSAVVSPDAPSGDGLKSLSVDKIPGQMPSANLAINGNVAGLWDRVAIFRYADADLSKATARVLADSTAKADMSGFTGVPIAVVNRPSSTSTTDILYSDAGITVGQWNCYLVRSAYNTSPWFLTSTEAQQPECKIPV